MDERGAHEAASQAEELLAFDGCWMTENNFLQGCGHWLVGCAGSGGWSRNTDAGDLL